MPAAREEIPARPARERGPASVPAVAGLALACALALGAVAGSAAADVYKWVDDQGNTHFADSPYLVPERYRERIHVRPDPDAAAALEGQVEGEAGAEAATSPSAPAPWSSPGQPAEAAAEEPPGNFSFNVIPSERPAGQADPELEGASGEMDPADLQALLEGSGISPAQLLAMGGAALVAFGVGLLVAIFIGLAISALVLIQACKWAGVEPPGFGRAFGTSFAAGFASAVPGALANVVGVAAGDPGAAVALAGVSFFASIAAQVAVYRWLLTESTGKAVVVWILNLVIWIGVTIGLVAAGLLLAFC